MPPSLQQPQPDDQRNVIIATVLIALITFVWMWQFSPEPTQRPTNQEAPVTDTSAAQAQAQERLDERQDLTDAEREGAGAEALPERQPVQDSTLAGALTGTAQTFVVETDVYEATFSSKGATLTSFRLKEYKKFDQETPVQLVDTTERGALALAFTTPANHNVDTRQLYFEPEVIGGARSGNVVRVEEDTVRLAFTARLGGGRLRQVYRFAPESYEVGLEVEQENAAAFATGAGYEVVWDGGLPFTESDPETEAAESGAFAYSGDVVSVTLEGEDTAEETLRGEVTWTAVKNKYFTAALLPDDPTQTRGAELIGDKLTDGGVLWEDYATHLLMAAPQPGQVDRYRLYLGPMDFFKISDYDVGLYDMVDYGWDVFEIVTRPLATFFFIPLFWLLHNFIPNYGIDIILIAVIVKLLVYPLTKSSYKSMAKMRELQPRMQEIKEEYGDDPQKQQAEMMKMYKETGVNPIGGCLPMLLQYPVIIALWQFLPTSIEIRQRSFLWANDLSVPDYILQLPFSIPLYGDAVAGFTLLMGLSMVVQMRVQQGSSASNPQAKILMYVFPFMIFFIFNRFAAGLSLYYLAYNIVTAIQQQFINKQIEKESEDAAATNGKGSAKDAESARRSKRKKKART